MLSKRTFITIMTMNLVILVLFLFSSLSREYFNDYDVNHSVNEELITRNTEIEIIDESPDVIYIGTTENECYDAVQQWTYYRKITLKNTTDISLLEQYMDSEEKPYIIFDGKLLNNNTDEYVQLLTQYCTSGGVVIFYRLPEYSVIADNWNVRQLLGIQLCRSESVTLHEIRLYSGFMLGGETCYSFTGLQDESVADLERNIPWYDISARTKSYMVGFISADEKESMGLNNEDMPAIIWRSGIGTGKIFAVNGNYMMDNTAIGILDAMVYESEEYALYSVINAQNLSFTGYPDITNENEDNLAGIYGMNSIQFCRDILWPSFVAIAQKNNWKITTFISVKQSVFTSEQPDLDELISYLKYINEESGEAGITLGRMDGNDFASYIREDRSILDGWGMKYQYAAGYVQTENIEKIRSLISRSGELQVFRDIRTIVGEYERNSQTVGWISDHITYQNATTNAKQHRDSDSLLLKSMETSLGYSNIQVDIHPVLWPENKEDEWQTIAEKAAGHIDTYWKPFSAFEKTTISESDVRVRDFLNGVVESERQGDTLQIHVSKYASDAYLLLRTHGEIPVAMDGGSIQKVEEDCYLLTVSQENAVVKLQSENMLYYTE